MSKDVMLYALSTCIHCRNTKEYLDANGVEYDYVYVDKLEGDEKKRIVEEIKKFNAGCSFPTVVIRGGERVVIGFHKKDLADAIGFGG